MQSKDVDAPQHPAYRFGAFELDVVSRELRRSGIKLALRPQSFQVLLMLVETPGRVVRRADLIERLWGDQEVFVDFDLGLNSAVGRLRDILRDDARAPRFIETVPRLGYRFVATVESVALTAELPVGRLAVDRSPRAMRRRSTALVLGAVLLLSVSWWVARRPGQSGSPSSMGAPAERPGATHAAATTIAVAPFVASTPATEHSFLGEVLAQEILANLGALGPPSLDLIGWHSSSRRLLPAADLGEAARELGADYLLSGSLTAPESGVRVVALLQRTEDGAHVLEQTLEQGDATAFVSVGNIARRVATAVASSLQIADALAASGPRNAEAHESYLRGLYFLAKSDVESWLASSGHFTKAMTLEPDFAKAHMGLARAQLRLLFSDEPSLGSWAVVRTAAQAALSLDPRLGNAHAALGMARLVDEWDFAAAGESLQQAVALLPGDGEIQSIYAAYLAITGRTVRALARARLARRLDPERLAVRADLCWHLLHARRFDEALQECGRALEIEPGERWSSLGMAEAHSARGDDAKALPHLSRALAIELPEAGAPQPSPSEVWRQVDARFPEIAEPGPTAYLAAVASVLAGRPERGFQWLEAAFAFKDPAILFLRIDPRLARLHNDRRFEQLADRIGLPPLADADRLRL